MVHLLIPGRHLKRLLFAGLAWTCVCLVALRVSSRRDDGTKRWDGPTGQVQSSSQNRELLQNVAPVDYSSFPGITTDSKPSSTTGDDGRLKVDGRPTPNESDLLLSLAEVSNLPLAYWAKIKKTLTKKTVNRANTCKVDFPSLYELDYNNIHWQRFASSNGTFYLYGAYYDDRWRGGPLPMVRILSMIDRVNPTSCCLPVLVRQFKVANSISRFLYLRVVSQMGQLQRRYSSALCNNVQSAQDQGTQERNRSRFRFTS